MIGAGRHPNEFTLLRLTDRGTLDRSFGHHGFVRTHFGRRIGVATAVVVQPNGRIVAAGWRRGGGLAVARYLPR